MFKAIDKKGNNEVVILDPKWEASINTLRQLGQQDALICQGCKAPVHVRAGEMKHWHFAHKHLGNCTHGTESAELLQARAALYTLLRLKLGDGVQIEHNAESAELPHPIDCWMETGAERFAYWILDSQIRPDTRSQVGRQLGKIATKVHWVFISQMLHPDEQSMDRINLSTTEREFMEPCYFDDEWIDGHPVQGGSLHYLDYQDRKLITYRCLRLIHKPQQYEGFRKCNGLTDILVSRRTGEFAHPGEKEQMVIIKGKRRRYDSERSRLAALADRRGQESKQPARRLTSGIDHETNDDSPLLFGGNVEISQAAAFHDGERLDMREGTCEFCGRTTSDWWSYDGATGMCKCNECGQDASTNLRKATING